MKWTKIALSLAIATLLTAGVLHIYSKGKANHNRELMANSLRTQGFVISLSEEVIKYCAHKNNCLPQATDEIVAKAMSEDGFTSNDRKAVRAAILEYVNIMDGHR